MELSEAFLQKRDEELREGMQQVMQLGMKEVMQPGIRTERRATIENLLKFRFGSLDDELSAIIAPLLELPNEEFIHIMMQLSRDELLARFRDIRGLTEV